MFLHSILYDFVLTDSQRVSFTSAANRADSDATSSVATTLLFHFLVSFVPFVQSRRLDRGHSSVPDSSQCNPLRCLLQLFESSSHWGNHLWFHTKRPQFPFAQAARCSHYNGWTWYGHRSIPFFLAASGSIEKAEPSRLWQDETLLRLPLS